MKRRILIASAGLILILAGFFVFWPSAHHDQPQKLTVSFLGFTNDSSHASCAAFLLSNSGPQSICRTSSYQILSANGHDLIKNAPLSYDYMDRILRPGDSETILVPKPVGAKTWRAGFNYYLYRGRIGSVAEDWVIGTRRTFKMKAQDVRHWGTGLSDAITE
jgi:hypothetical protein